MCVGRPGSLIGQSKEYPTTDNATFDGFTTGCLFYGLLSHLDHCDKRHSNLTIYQRVHILSIDSAIAKSDTIYR